MTEKLLVRHCAPTLAAIKTGNIFSCVFEDAEEMKNLSERPTRLSGERASGPYL